MIEISTNPIEGGYRACARHVESGITFAAVGSYKDNAQRSALDGLRQELRMRTRPAGMTAMSVSTAQHRHIRDMRLGKFDAKKVGW